MSVAETISNRIKHMRKGQPFAGSVFSQVGTRTSVDKALSRLVQEGKLERVIRGIYMRPKESKVLGRVRPSPIQVVEAVARRRREKLQIHGAEAVRRLGISTQMQVQTVYYTSGSTREIRVGRAVVRLQHVSSEHLQEAGTRVGVALVALFYLGRKEASTSVIQRILRSLNREEFRKLQACSKPEWMQPALEQAAKDVEWQPLISTCQQKTRAAC
ncbi:type IV toxin-antitoxin system AbiEi family antitoxin domain-containing protein [Pseudomonas sp. AO-1]|uniref:DUF6088 family protein n=1 Tax=Pseudomonas sp. AO-1 TaxID=2855434 RepID=UPI001C75AF68|nr:DUF6088 family protein [Pseudomonas sp. AO-1]QXZ14685.1 type IV toxin-antitoxin system AbiEi family antitoxin domain-containing protein [Pseudomonas sp. AO-1]